MRCSLCKTSAECFTTVEQRVKKGKHWELELCDDCRLDLVSHLFSQMIIEWDVATKRNSLILNKER